MEIKQPTVQKLIVEEKPFLEQLIPLAVAGAGIMLVIGAMREYGVQAWYRFTYMAGIALAFWGIAYLLIGPKGSTIVLDLTQGKMKIQHKQGIRLIVHRLISLQHIQEIRIEKREPKRTNAKPSYRLAARVEEEWVPLMHWAKRDLYDYETAAKKIQGFLKRANEEREA